jgi:small subunit ribosomal protein S18
MEEQTRNISAPAGDRGVSNGNGEPPRGRDRDQQRRGRFGVRPPRQCPFCKNKVEYIDFKQSDQLRRFLTDRGKIKARRKVGTCARHQRMLAVAIKRARHVALLPFTTQHVRGE